MRFPIEAIASITGGKAQINIPGSEVGGVIIDHRDLNWRGAIFVAIKGMRHDGHDFIPDLLNKGVRHFLISDEKVMKMLGDRANFILVEDPVAALQALAAHHRAQYNIPVIGITGSNGKTIIKEWLNDILRDDYKICRSPKSFNSQIGVPLSVLKLNGSHTLAIFEVGISMPGEMEALEKIVKPTIGLFTNLGDAHAAHFASKTDKLAEKLKLFKEVDTMVFQHGLTDAELISNNVPAINKSWSYNQDGVAYIEVRSVKKIASGVRVSVSIAQGKLVNFDLPFGDKSSIENLMHCITVASVLGLSPEKIQTKIKKLSPVSMRMEIKPGVRNSTIIDDTYNADLGSLSVALEQLASLPNKKKLVILSDLTEASPNGAIYRSLNSMMEQNEIENLIGVGPKMSLHKASFNVPNKRFFSSMEAFLNTWEDAEIENCAVLIKGARKFRMERLSKRLQRQSHDTVLEINLHSLTENLNFFRQKLKPETKIMVMVKAFAYGSGGHEIALHLQEQKVDYLAVAYTDEGRLLREKGVDLPIMVMSPTYNAFDTLIAHDLEPELYSLKVLQEFAERSAGQRLLQDQFNIHLKVDTGMHRLGFEVQDLPQVVEVLNAHPQLKVRSVFSHLSASGAPEHDNFTERQCERLVGFCDGLQAELGYAFDRHLLNSSGVLRFPKFQLEMVRLGIGLYGFGPELYGHFLKSLGTFKTYIAQTKHVKAGESIGYNRAGIASHDRRIATLSVGYADGIDRRLGNGQWEFKVDGEPCPTVGDICMDMCMIDVSKVQAEEGDEVIFFDSAKEVAALATQLGTIPYEILTGISQRVRRVYQRE